MTPVVAPFLASLVAVRLVLTDLNSMTPPMDTSSALDTSSANLVSNNPVSRATYFAANQSALDTYIDVLMRLHAENPTERFDVLAFEASERAEHNVATVLSLAVAAVLGLVGAPLVWAALRANLYRGRSEPPKLRSDGDTGA